MDSSKRSIVRSAYTLLGVKRLRKKGKKDDLLLSGSNPEKKRRL